MITKDQQQQCGSVHGERASEVGEKGMAIFAEDGLWYPCVIKSTTRRISRVLFEGYGNEQDTEECLLFRL